MYWARFFRSTLILFATASNVALAQAPPEKQEEPVHMLGFDQPCKKPIELDKNNEPVGNKSDFKPPNYRPDRPASTPTYPPYALRSGQEGAVYLDLYVTDEGRIGEVRVKKSSGWPLLDNAAMESTRDWMLKPGERRNEPVCMWVTAPIVFRLETYTRAELSAATITPDAMSLARYVLGEKMLEEQLPKYANESGDATTKVVAGLFAELMNQPRWGEASREVAAMLAIEMTPDELSELHKYFSTPVMQKYLTVAPKMEEAVQRNQRKLAGIAFCISSAIGEFSRRNVAIKAPDDQMPNEILKRMPRFVNELTPYCSCWTNAKLQLGKDGSTEHCGKKPDVKW